MKEILGQSMTVVSFALGRKTGWKHHICALIFVLTLFLNIFGSAWATTNNSYGMPVGMLPSASTPQSELDVSGGVGIGSYAGLIGPPSGGIIVSGKVGIGTNSPQAQLEVNGGAIMSWGGTTADEGSCASNKAGDIWYTGSATNTLKYCDGTAWRQITTETTTTNSGTSGYFVMSKTTYTGVLTTLAAADSSCLTDITTNTSWKDYATANSNGQLISGNVHAFLCDGAKCNVLNPSTTYIFEDANNATHGGATFTTDINGFGPGDSNTWSNATFFGATYTYWTMRLAGSGTTTVWGYGSNLTTNCTNLTSSGANGSTGTSNSAAAGRWLNAASVACSTAEHLICYVNP